MKTATTTPTNTNRNSRKSKDPKYKRVIVGYRMVAMQASQVDAITPPERLRVGSRCPRCFLKTDRGHHPCRWNISATVEPKDPNPPILQIPIYAWVRRDAK